MNILVLSFFPAYTPITNGGQSRLWNLYSALSKMHSVRLISSAQLDQELEVVLHGGSFVEYRVPKDRYFADSWQRLTSIASGGDLSGPAQADSGSRITAFHRALLHHYEWADVIVHDSPFTIYTDVLRYSDGKPRVYNSYNCESDLYEQLHPSEVSKPLHGLIRAAELEALECSQLVCYCSDGDLRAFSKMIDLGNRSSLWLPNGAWPRFDASPKREHQSVQASKRKQSVLFMGSAHPPNTKAAEFIVEHVAPKLPGVDFHIVGSCWSARSSNGANVTVHGTVADDEKQLLLSRMDIAINPMEDGSGSNVKVFDYFASELPVLSTSHGMRGVRADRGVHYCETTLDDFGSTLLALLADRALLRRVGSAGHDLFKKSFTWNQIALRFSDALVKTVHGETSNLTQRTLFLNDYDSFEAVGGGATRTQGLVRAVAKRMNTTLLSFASDERLTVRRRAHQLASIAVPRTPQHIGADRAFNERHWIATNDIVDSFFCLNNHYLVELARILSASHEHTVVEHCYMVPLALYLGKPFVYSSQNCETELKRTSLESHPDRELLIARVRELERYAVDQSQYCVAVSREDATLLSRVASRVPPILVVRNAVSTPEAAMTAAENSQNESGVWRRNAVVFVGSSHPPNMEAARFIADKLAIQLPFQKFMIVGSVCSALDSVPNNVTVIPYLSDTDKSRLLHQCAIALNPVVSGGGSNVKLADYLAHGLYVVSTQFGVRGYPKDLANGVKIARLDEFAEAVTEVLRNPQRTSVDARAQRVDYFRRFLSAEIVYEKFVDLLLSSAVRGRKRVLYVCYRYSYPPQGGAEVMQDRFIQALSRSGSYEVDVVAPKLTHMRSLGRFGEEYMYEHQFGLATDLERVSTQLFDLDVAAEGGFSEPIRQLWSTQPRYERILYEKCNPGQDTIGFSWGWAPPDFESNGRAVRWSYVHCGFQLEKKSRISLRAFIPYKSTVSVYQSDVLVVGAIDVEGIFDLDFVADRGCFEMKTDTAIHAQDPRPLGFWLKSIDVDGRSVDLSEPMIFESRLRELSAKEVFEVHGAAMQESRSTRNDRLTDVRGPHSLALEAYIRDNLARYDLVVAGNNVFKPAVFAISEAKKQGVPSILIPHPHLDDDFYHFPDWHECAKKASIVLASPRAACSFLESRGCNTSFLTPGIDTGELFTDEDVEAFRRVYPDKTAFVLVLGRKAPAKGYRAVSRAVGGANRRGHQIKLVVIGPDDDGLALDEEGCIYLGAQPRAVVRGALQECLLLCNMSSSESFGMVVIEAWKAMKPVVLNNACAAFHDIAKHNEDAIFVDVQSLEDALVRLIAEPSTRRKLAQSGHAKVQQYSWDTVCDEFLSVCRSLTQTRST